MVAWLAFGVVAYAYAGYPLLLLLLRRVRMPDPPHPVKGWPSVSISLPVYNGEGSIGPALESILANDYPGECQILVISDGSTDATEQIVAAFAPRGVELLALPVRVGKSEAENLGVPHLRGEVVINTDASVRLHRGAITALAAAMADPSVGVASGCDVSVDGGAEGSEGETTYVDYEMRLRELETATGGIVGASGCLYATRAALHHRAVAPALSRDFSAALHAHAMGYRAVSVPQARCFVPRGRPGRSEYRRKVRTMARGLATLGHHRALLDPLRHGGFAWKLISHKLLRWCTPFALVAIALLLVLPGVGPRWGPALVGSVLVAAAAGWWWPGRRPPQALVLPAYAAGAILAGLHAWWSALTGNSVPIWEPTRRVVTTPPGGRP
jgi:hypothetical protein